MSSKTDDAATEQRGTRYAFLLVVGLLWLTGCAVKPGSATLPTPEVEPKTAPILVAQASSPTSPPASANDQIPEEPFDPFAQPGEVELDEYDPWEPLNTKVFEFNRQVDRWVLKPVATGYDFIVPNPVQIGISNFFYNLRFTPRFVNNIFQGKVKGAAIEVGRFLVNTTVGVAGFIDVAQHLDLNTPEEDTGQTLGFYGVKPGPYLVLPFMQPFTVRDLAGYAGDIFLNPINWLVLPIIEVSSIPSVIAHEDRLTSSLIQIGGRIFEIVNDRSLNLEKYEGVEEATLELYSAVRNAYLQKRARAIQE